MDLHGKLGLGVAKTRERSAMTVASSGSMLIGFFPDGARRGGGGIKVSIYS